MMLICASPFHKCHDFELTDTTRHRRLATASHVIYDLRRRTFRPHLANGPQRLPGFGTRLVATATSKVGSGYEFDVDRYLAREQDCLQILGLIIGIFAGSQQLAGFRACSRDFQVSESPVLIRDRAIGFYEQT